LKTLTIIDTFGFLFRSFYALPPLKSKSGHPTGMITGFMNFIASIGKDFQTDYLIFALDSKGDSFRNEIYTEYKAHRPDVPDDLKAQLPVCIELIEKMGFKSASKSGYEADDIIASLSADAKKEGLKVRIVSHDKDLYQLIEEDIFMFDPIKKKNITSDDCFKKYGVYPEQFTDYQSLLGDSADNVPGVKGVGAKTAEALISQFDSLDNIYANIDNIEKPRWQKLLNEGKDMAYISKQLVCLDKECISLNEFEAHVDEWCLPLENPILKVADELRELDMNNIINKVHKEGTSYKTVVPKDYVEKEIVTEEKIDAKVKYILVNDEKELLHIVNGIPKDSIVAFDTETTGLDSLNEDIVGFSFCYENTKSFYVPIAHFYLGVPEQVSKEVAKQVIEVLNNHKLVLHNFKYDFEIIKNNFGVELNLYADSMIMAWLLNSDKAVGLDKLALEEFNHTMIAFKDVVKKGENFSNIDLDDACKYAAEDAYITKLLYDRLLVNLEKEKVIYDVAKSLEFPFIKVLSELQTNGIKVDVKFLEELKGSNKEYIDGLVSSIYELSGCEFNINSPKQLGEVLFVTLELPHGKKTKTGYSTNEQVLQKLKGEHPVIDKLMEYREAFKLQSTYIEPLLELGLSKEDNRIHTSFLQTGTATGRLSSKNPNLQNIPVRSEAGRNIRKGFIARDGYKLFSVDYSQIELRLLAHFSKDKALCEAFNNGEDIHTRTAIEIFGEEDAAAKRNIAKSINFGLIYGMGAKKLGETLGIPTKEAKGYIEKYFESFTNIKEYLSSVESDAQNNGYIKTLLGRKRKFDFASATPMLKAAYLREAVNAVFQGSAADLIKLSMLEIFQKYQRREDVKMLLQIHDELIFEIKEEILDEVVGDMKDIMSNIYSLEIPLEVSGSIGDNWSELK
jgi:DNA polymerase-1